MNKKTIFWPAGIITMTVVIIALTVGCTRRNESSANVSATVTEIGNSSAILVSAQDSPNSLLSIAEENPLMFWDWIDENEEYPIIIWGWSRDGKVSITELSSPVGHGGIFLNAFVLNAVTDQVLLEDTIEITSWDDDGRSYIPESIITDFFNNFLNLCKQQFGIEIQGERPEVPGRPAFTYDGRTYNVSINELGRSSGGIMIRYSVVVETDGRRKTIKTEDAYNTLPWFYGYTINPFEDRALIIIRGNPGGEYNDNYHVYAGCHLVTGFR